MSRQIKTLKIYSLSENDVKVSLDLEDFTAESNINKIITHQPDFYASVKDEIHGHIKDRFGKIISVDSSDPLILKTSGYPNVVIDGYDGFIIDHGTGTPTSTTTATASTAQRIGYDIDNNVMLTVFDSTVYKSENSGSTWVKVSTLPAIPNRIEYIEEQWFALGPTGSIYVSEDQGTTWVTRTPDSGFSDDLADIKYSKSLLRMVIVGDSGKIYSSDDLGETWVERTAANGYVSNWSSLSYGKDQWIAVGTSGEIQTSPDGIAWTKQVSGVSAYINDVSFGNGIWLITSGRKISLSKDGITWNNDLVTSAVDVTSIAYGAGLFLIMGSNTAPSVNKTYVYDPAFNTLTETLVTESQQAWSAVFNEDNEKWVVVSNGGVVSLLPKVEQTARGKIKSTSQDSVRLSNPAYTSSSTHHYILGGYDEDAATYTNKVWHSTDGELWESITSGPWGGRINALAVNDDKNIWIIGGSASSPKKDIWKGVISPGGDIFWESSAVASNISILTNYHKGTITPNLDAYVGAGQVNLNTGAETSFNFGTDTTGSVMHYDPLRKVLWFSTNGVRQEYKITHDGEVYDTDVSTPFGYVHREVSASENWVINHGLNTRNVAPIIYNSNHIRVSPKDVDWVDDNTMQCNFTTPVSGRALVCLATPYSGATWRVDNVDGYGPIDHVGYMPIKNGGGTLEAATTTVSSNLFYLNFNAAQDGYLVVWKSYESGALKGRRFSKQYNWVSGANYANVYQNTNAALYTLRDSSTHGLILPSAVDYTNIQAASFTLSGVASVDLASFNLRNDGYKDNEDPFSSEFLTLGSQYRDLGAGGNRQLVYILAKEGVWVSPNAGCNWVQTNATDSNLPNDKTTVALVDGSMVAALNDGYAIVRSTDAGNNWSEFPNSISEQSITFYGPLTSETVDTEWRLFISERPSDVIWEKEYGYLRKEIVDKNESRYVLPSAVTIDSASSQSATVTIVADSRNVTANEFVGDWAYIWDDSNTSTLYRRQIIRNESGVIGGTFSIFWKTELPITIQAGTDMLQIIKDRPDQMVYGSVITRNTDDNYDIFTEENSSWFSGQETAFDWYGKKIISGGLQQFILDERGDNENIQDLLQTELNRVRSEVSGTNYNAPLTLSEINLERLNDSLGVEHDTSINLRTLRHMTSLWHSEVDAYGASVGGINNIIELIFGKDSGVEATVGNLSTAISGRSLNINISAVATRAFDYVAANAPKYDSVRLKWYMPVSTSILGISQNLIPHQRLSHFSEETANDPLLIVDNIFDSATTNYHMFFDDDTVATLGYNTSSSKIAIYDDPTVKKVYWLIRVLNKLKPDWVSITYN